mgnify:CR=1 FL=1
MISARFIPKLLSLSAGRAAIRLATRASTMPPTAEKVWNESDRTATDPVQMPIPSSITK